ncbi:MAG: toll/interleukin-1 receptor domain-containing protein [Petrotogales bacterium]
MSKREINFFVAYAHKNKGLVNGFLDKLQDVLAPSKNYYYVFWKDSGLIIGEEWEKQISKAINECHFGLLLISPAFLASKFITENELPAFVSGTKPAIPVLLQPVDFAKHDLKGLEKQQIFRLDWPGFKKPRAYGECKPKRRETFVFELFELIEDKLG